MPDEHNAPASELPDPLEGSPSPSRDPWHDTRPVAERIAERERRFAPINAAFAAAAREEKQLRRAEVTRFKRSELTPGELLQEIEQLEQRLRVIWSSPPSDRRDVAYAYYTREIEQATHQLARLNKAGVQRIEPPALDFTQIKHVDLVGIAQTLLSTAGRKTGDRWVFPCFLHEDWEPSLVVYPPGGGWFCFQCNHGGGDAASFAAEYFETTMIEGLRWVVEMADGAHAGHDLPD